MTATTDANFTEPTTQEPVVVDVEPVREYHSIVCWSNGSVLHFVIREYWQNTTPKNNVWLVINLEQLSCLQKASWIPKLALGAGVMSRIYLTRLPQRQAVLLEKPTTNITASSEWHVV